MSHPFNDKSRFTTAKSNRLEQFDVAYLNEAGQERKASVSIYHRKLSSNEDEFFGTITNYGIEHWLGVHLWYIKPEHYDPALAEFQDRVEIRLITCGFFRGSEALI